MVNGMNNVVDDANNDIAEQEESTGSVPCLLISGTKLNKRLRSKVWDDFTPTFVDGKVVRAECMHCHQVFNCKTNGTSSLLRHQAKCRPGTHKRPRMQEHTSLPSTQKGTVAAGSDPKQKKLPFLQSSQKKCTGTEHATPAQKELSLPDTPTNMNRKNPEVHQNGSHEEPAAPGQKNLALPGVSADNNTKNQCNEETTSPEWKDIPTDTSGKHQEADEDCSHEELIGILAMHGNLPRMVEQDGFKKLVAWLNPIIKMPSHDDLMVSSTNLFQKEQSKLKEELAALGSCVCLSAYMWYYDPILAFLCLRVHYIDDEWEKQQKIIAFHAMDSSCSAKKLSDIILGAIGQWGLDGKVFSIILDDAFIDDSVASNVKANLQKRNPLAANRSLFVVRYATHLLDQVVQVGLDELDKILEKLAKCSKYTKGLTLSAVQYPNCRYAPSSKDWRTAKRVCELLDDFHKCMDSIHLIPSPANFFDSLWDAKKEVHRLINFHSQYMDDEAFPNVLEKIKQKFKECWKVCFLHFCMPMVMDPDYRLKCIKPCFQFKADNDVEDYVQQVHDTLVNLFNEYSDQVEDPTSTSSSRTSKGTVVDGDTLMEYYRYSIYQYSERPMTELDQYVQAPHITTGKPIGLRKTTGKPSVLQWWKEHCLTYPTIARMARDILALPCTTDWKVATRTATLAISEPGSKQWIEELVCTQDWLISAGTSTTREESDDAL